MVDMKFMLRAVLLLTKELPNIVYATLMGL